MRSFTVTAVEATKLPRWLLLLLCALYVIPGLVGRDPWRFEDAAGFGIAYSLAGLATGPVPGSLAWQVPHVFGLPVVEEGPVPFWLGAIAIRLLSPLAAADTAVRIAAMLWLTLTLVCVWYATYLLARRPEMQPDDPFGAAASRTDFARALADSALLVVLATFGLLARLHETTAEAAQVAWVALFLYGCAAAIERPRLGAALAGIAIALTTLSRGIPLALALAAVAAALPWLVHPFRLVRRVFLARVLAIALAGSILWPLWLSFSAPSAADHLQAWIQWNLSLVRGPTHSALGYYLRTAPWFFWPAWPIALWAAWRWRERLLEPALALPLLTVAATGFVALLAPRGAESHLLPMALPLAVLGALGLPTIRRGLISLVDWFAVMTFSLFGLVAWAYWIAFLSGWPPRMHYRISQSAAGFVPTLSMVELALGLLATIAWITLVAWRVSRQPRMIWRSVALSSGGMVLAWFLLSTLWLAPANHRKTYVDVAAQAADRIDRGHRCVVLERFDLAQRAVFGWVGGLRIAHGRQHAGCEWMLVVERGPEPANPPPAEPGWRETWTGSRPAERDERFRLYRRTLP